MSRTAIRVEPNPVLATAFRLHPQVLVRGSGPYVWDARHNKYLDCHLAWGSVLLGHANRHVVRAIRRQAALGTTIGGSSPWFDILSGLVHKMVPNAGPMRLGKNGSDVTLGATRAARAHTGKTFILKCGYHGFHDWSIAADPAQPGLPAGLERTVAELPFNHIERLRESVALHRQDLAAIVIDPCADGVASKSFLLAARELADATGAVLIFDEIMSGFRLAKGGIQEVHGVHADLVCLGKSLANGMPLSLVTGTPDVMQAFSRIWYGLTFEQETISMAAGAACLELVDRLDVPRRLAERGEYVRARFHETAARLGIEARLVGPPARMVARFAHSPLRGSPLSQGARFVEGMFKERVLICNVINLSFAHDGGAIEWLVRGCTSALQHVDNGGRSARTTSPITLRADISAERARLVAAPGAEVSLHCVVRNSGELPWSVGALSKDMVTLGVHLVRDSLETVDHDFHREPLRGVQFREVLPPGETCELDLRLRAPPEPGSYCLELDCVLEGKTWFADVGSPVWVSRLVVADDAQTSSPRQGGSASVGAEP